ncbi:MAG: hypothetical protein CM15mV2_0120 [uncultured marine virus]|nr:MAG: hypothetical protein CM15mV2_0120 [uncultured marine virus]
MNKSFIVTNIEYDKYLKTEKQIEDLDFKVDNAYGIWYGKAIMMMNCIMTYG